MNESRPHWKEVPGYEGLYEVSDHGAVRSLNYLRTGNRSELKPLKNSKGYEQVGLYSDGVQNRFTVHRLVWEAFNGQIPDGKEIDHINGVKNDNRLVNLRVVTPIENVNNPATRKRFLEANKRMTQDPKWQEAHRNACAKPVLQLDKETGEVLREWECSADVERVLGIHNQSISACCNGKRKTAGGFKWHFADHPNKSQICDRITAILNDRGFR